VNEVKSNLSQIGFDIEVIHNMISGLVNRTLFSPFFKHPID